MPENFYFILNVILYDKAMFQHQSFGNNFSGKIECSFDLKIQSFLNFRALPDFEDL